MTRYAVAGRYHALVIRVCLAGVGVLRGGLFGAPRWAGRPQVGVREVIMCREILERLEVDVVALKRAQYEAFSFEVEPGRVTVRNQSWADPKEHEYSVRVIDGVPTDCTCPADEHQDGACKHRLAVAIRSPVQQAAASDPGMEPIPDGGRPSPGTTDNGDRESAAECSCS